MCSLSPDLGGRFVEGLTESFALPTPLITSVLSALETHLSSTFTSNLIIEANSDFNVNDFVSNTLNALSQAFSNLVSPVVDKRECIQGVLTRLINSDVQGLVDRSIQIVRQSYTVLIQIRDFLVRSANPDFTPVQGCIDEFVRLSYCGRCTQRIPPLCRGTCNNVVRGCLSPIYTAYRNDFNNVWLYARNIITNLKMNIAELFSEEGQIIGNIVAAVGEYRCSV